MKARAKVLRADYKPERGTVVVLEVTLSPNQMVPGEESLSDAELLMWARHDGANPFDLELPTEPVRRRL